jgi:hypothetical protein
MQGVLYVSSLTDMENGGQEGSKTLNIYKGIQKVLFISTLPFLDVVVKQKLFLAINISLGQQGNWTNVNISHLAIQYL